MNLREAAEMALEAWEKPYGERGQAVEDAIEALRQALAQPEQEPVGYVTDSGASAYLLKGVDLDDDTPLYAAPPKREWVGYTNEDRERIVPVLVQSLLNHDDKTMALLLKAILIDIEQQLKEKNT